jgi:signal transduction histidine kinase
LRPLSRVVPLVSPDDRPMTPRELALAVASPEPARVRAAVRACGDYLRSDDLSEDRRGLAEVLLGLAAHADPEVRQGVADVCDLFPGPVFARALEVLTADRDSFVKNAAKRAGDRRARRGKMRAKSDEQDRALGELYAEMDRLGKPARRLAERSVRRGVEHFVVRLDHELKKPAAAIDRTMALLGAEIDLADRSPVELRKHHAELAQELGLLRSIVARAFAYAQPFTPVFRAERIASIVDEARRQLALRTELRGARVDFALDADPELTADVDRNALLQVLQNLLENAIEAYAADDAGPLAVRVSVRAIVSGSQVEIAVADRGRGMSDEQRTKLFVPFGSTKPGGSGLGLLVARKMIDAHEGELTFAPAPDAGTIVTVTLPAAQPGAR